MIKQKLKMGQSTKFARQILIIFGTAVKVIIVYMLAYKEISYCLR